MFYILGALGYRSLHPTIRHSFGQMCRWKVTEEHEDAWPPTFEEALPHEALSGRRFVGRVLRDTLMSEEPVCTDIEE